MKTVNDGGPAFPAICNSVNGVPLSPGVTVRDYFAAKALQGLSTQLNMNNCLRLHAIDRKNQARQMADMAFEMAAAMIAAREGGA